MASRVKSLSALASAVFAHADCCSAVRVWGTSGCDRAKEDLPEVFGKDCVPPSVELGQPAEGRVLKFGVFPYLDSLHLWRKIRELVASGGGCSLLELSSYKWPKGRIG